jgi:hypothetical protein
MNAILFRIFKYIVFLIGVIGAFLSVMIIITKLMSLLQANPENVRSIFPFVFCEIILLIYISIWWRKVTKSSMSDIYQLDLRRLLTYVGMLGLISGFSYAALLQIIGIISSI